MYIDGEAFFINTEKPDQWFEYGPGGNCNAKIYVTVFNGKLLYRFINHSEEFAHNHSDEPAKYNKPAIDTPPMEHIKGGGFGGVNKPGKLYVELLDDSSFDNADVIERVPNKHQIHDKITGKLFLVTHSQCNQCSNDIQILLFIVFVIICTLIIFVILIFVDFRILLLSQF